MDTLGFRVDFERDDHGRIVVITPDEGADLFEFRYSVGYLFAVDRWVPISGDRLAAYLTEEQHQAARRAAQSR